MKSFMKSLLMASVLALSMIPAASAFAQSAQDYFEQGNKLYNQKKYSEAVASYGHAIQLQPQSLPKAYLNCARAYSMLKNYPASAQYYAFYESVSADAASDKKFKAEYKAVEKKAKNESYVRDSAQTTVLKQLQELIRSNGPFMARQGNSIMAYYDVLLRSGFAEPELYNIQKKIAQGLYSEIETDITPQIGQPLPNLDRTGWEYIHTKVARLRQFVDIPVSSARLDEIDNLATAWETFYRGDYESAQTLFENSCKASPAIPAAFWGRIMLDFQFENNSVLLDRISQTEKIYRDAEITGTAHYFALLRAQAYRNLGDIQHSLESLSAMQESL